MSSQKRTARQIRRAVGSDVAETVAFTEVRTRLALSILRRGFWGRMLWLFLGR